MASSTVEKRPTTETATTKITIGIIMVLVVLLAVGFLSSNSSARTGPAAVELPVGREAVSTPLTESKPVGIEIPSIGVKATSIMNLGLNEDRSLQVPKDAKTIGWYDRGAYPGTEGPAVFASHINYGGVDGGFADLADVKSGDQVVVPRADATTAVFVVDRIETVSKKAFPTARVYGPTFRPEIRLITCGGDFDSSVRSYEDNVVVYGHLTEAFRT